MSTGVELRYLAAPAFLRALPALVDIYMNAMAPPADHAAGRRAIMEHHAQYPRFHAVVAVSTGNGTAAGFAYGFRGQRGQWWHDSVLQELLTRAPSEEHQWFSNPFELAELHVHPSWQGHGVGRSLLERLAAVRSERTAALSTHSGATAAHRLYRSCGFTDVLREFYFPGNPHQPFTVMSARLPLRERGSRKAAHRSHGWLWTG
ncbi:GNAT family N-acetyltransferase [Haloactinospora alba]|uniref:GNAT family N-acetyltransferase n=1 Tax=Haloactinospora alba TaxID=405555 RepID=UPI001FE5EDC2|nr:GNAT family N-acetyltransferase [Haloactinospora alba]